jgi:hypothetical protein
MALKLDLEKDFAEVLRQRLAAAGYPPINGETNKDTITRYLNVLNRRIERRARETKKAAGFSCPPEHQACLDALLKVSEAGGDLRPYQSRAMETDNYDDGMLNAWGLHHFHMGTEPHPRFPTYKARTGQLLYGVVTDETLYCLCVLPHKHWSDQELIELLDKNFPELTAKSTLKGQLKGLAVRYSDADVQKLRNAGINTLTETSTGNIIAPPGGGMNLSKQKGQKSLKVTQAVIKVRNRLKVVEGEINRKATALGVPDGHQILLTEKNGGLIATDAKGTFNIEIESLNISLL